MHRVRVRSPGARDAADERRVERFRALGIPPRELTEDRDSFPVRIDAPGLRLRWTARPYRWRPTLWRVTDDDTGACVMIGNPRAIWLAAARRVPMVRASQVDD